MTTDKQQFMSEFCAFVERHFGDGGITLGRLGLLWKAQHGETDWRAVGFAKISDAVSEIADAPGSDWEVLNRGTPGVLVRRRGDQREPPAQGFRPVNGARTNRLSTDVWNAFINEPDGRRRYLNRGSGVVRYATEPPSPAEEWVEITPIEQNEQRQWAKKFLEENSLTDRQDLLGAIELPQWYHHFKQALAPTPALPPAWNSLRTRRVVQRVEAWCAEHGIDVTMVRTASPVASPGTAGLRTAGGLVGAAEPKGELRRVLLAALGGMPTHDLLRVQVPAYAIIAALRPDLLD